MAAGGEGGLMKHDPVNARIGQGGYVSEYEQFLNVYLASHPEVRSDQKRGWYIWWDHQVDSKDLEPRRNDDAPAKSYKYE
jgi:hypothetical protein